MHYHRFIKSVFQLRASSIDRDADSSISATTTTQNNAEPPTTDLKELASRIDKNKSSRGLLVRGDQETSKSASSRPRYQLGVGKNLPVAVSTDSSSNNSSSNNNNNITAVLEQKEDILSAAMNWNVPQPATKKQQERQRYDMGLGKHSPISNTKLNDDDRGDTSNNGYGMRTTMRLLPNRGEESARLTKAVWDEGHFVDDDSSTSLFFNDGSERELLADSSSNNGYEQRFVLSAQQQRLHQQQQQQQQQQQDQQQNDVITDYRQIDLSIPPSVYSLGSSSSSPTSSSNSTSTINGVDLVWDLMRQEAQAEAAREPLLVSFLYSTILNHPTLESALSFHLANRLSSPAMLSTQIMSLIQEALDADPNYRISLRADILAVRDRDPACHCLPDVFLYFKGFHALQTYRAAHYLWKSGRRVLAHYLQSQVSQHFQIDIREFFCIDD
jgi:serine O-acetyltransferase